MGSFDHGPQQVEGKAGMCFIGFRGVIGPAVMTLGEYGDGVHITQLQHVLKLLFVELPSDRLNRLRGVKIQMNLPEPHMISSPS
ncbi:hypothetical protein D3C73_1542090 [compost metagenome]